MSRVAEAAAARAMRDNPLWAQLIRQVRGEIAEQWLNAKDQAERESLGNQLKTVNTVVQLIHRLAGRAPAKLL